MSGLVVDYGPDVEDAIARLVVEIERTPAVHARYAPRWLATALLDEDPGLVGPLSAIDGGARLVEARDELLNDLRDTLGEQADTAIAAARFQTANTIAHAATIGQSGNGRDRTDRIDAVLTNRYLGIPIFLALMWAVFKITTDIAGAFLDWIDGAVSGPIAHFVESLVSLVGLEALRHAEVEQVCVVSGDEHIGRLQVPVNDSLSVCVGEGTRHIPQQGKRILDGYGTFPSENRPQGLALDVRHHVVGESLDLPRVDQCNDVRVGEPSGEADLAGEPVRAEPLRDLGTHDLENDQPVVLTLPGEEYNRHASPSQLTDDPVASVEGFVQQAGQIRRLGIVPSRSIRRQFDQGAIQDPLRIPMCFEHLLHGGQDRGVLEILLSEPVGPLSLG